MRLDKFLKVSRVIKRRTVANEACENGRVNINGRVAKPSANVKPGDVIEIAFGSGTTKIEVLAVTEHATKESARSMFKIL
jgi:ribosomal 50S subunit-recycling heat shock protein